MLLTVAALAALALPQTDTTIAVRPGTRLDVNNFGGSITVKAWNQSTVRVQADHSSHDEIEIAAGPTVVSVRSSSRRGGPHSVDYTISVPAATSLTLSGIYTDITVEGVGGEIDAQTVQGEVIVHGGSGNMTLKSVEGAVTLTDAKVRNVDLNTVNDNIIVSNVAGDITAESVNGDVELTNIDASNVEATSVDGAVRYGGTIKDGGRYSLSTHDGDVELAVPPTTNATVSVSTYDGDFEADFPVSVTTTKRRFTFTLGSGSARVELESFDGNIHLRRPGKLGGSVRHRNKNHNNNEDNQ
ncbi:MAG TPA: DUF4097 family beta strand repeat-containing protein [Gemmatimonadales bacterium]